MPPEFAELVHNFLGNNKRLNWSNGGFLGALRPLYEHHWNAHKQMANHLQMLRSSTARNQGVRYKGG